MAAFKAISLWWFCVISYSYLAYPCCLPLWTSFRVFFANQLGRHQIVCQFNPNVQSWNGFFWFFQKLDNLRKKFFLVCDQKIKCDFLMSYLARLHPPFEAHSHRHRNRVTWRHRSALRDFEMSAWRDEATSFLLAMHTKRDTSVAIGNAKHCIAKVRDWDDGFKLVLFFTSLVLNGLTLNTKDVKVAKEKIIIWLHEFFLFKKNDRKQHIQNVHLALNYCQHFSLACHWIWHATVSGVPLPTF